MHIVGGYFIELTTQLNKFQAQRLCLKRRQVSSLSKFGAQGKHKGRCDQNDLQLLQWQLVTHLDGAKQLPHRQLSQLQSLQSFLRRF